MTNRHYEDLIVWREAHALCLLVYKLTKKFPSDEKFRLVDQMCRAAYSAPTNIAEGNMRRTKKDKSHFFIISISSLEELHYQARLAFDLMYLSPSESESIKQQVHRVNYLLMRLRSSL